MDVPHHALSWHSVSLIHQIYQVAILRTQSVLASAVHILKLERYRED